MALVGIVRPAGKESIYHTGTNCHESIRSEKTSPTFNNKLIQNPWKIV